MLLTKPSHLAHRWPWLDGLRVGAALLVVFFHFCFRGYAADELSPVAYPALAPLAQYGYLGVEMFFVISGFVLLGSVRRQSVAQFILSRVVRLYPAYWVALLVLTSVLWLVPSSFGRPSPAHLAANLTMMQQFLRVRPIDGVYWTLTIELKFYALLLAVRYLGGLRYLPLVLLAWLGLVAWRLMSAASVPHVLASIFFLDYAAYFVVGLTFGLLAVRPRQPFVLLALLLASFGLAVASAWQEAVGESQHFGIPYSRTVIGLVLGGFFLVFAVAVSPWGQRLRPSAAAWLAALGSLTYPLYLLHHNLGYVAFQRLGNRWPPYGLLTTLVLLLLVAAYGLHRYLERPFARWLHTYLSSKLVASQNSIEG